MPCPENVKPYEYKPGQSGNPKGKPKGTLNLKTVIREILEEKVKDADGKSITRIALIAKTIAERAEKGHIQAFESLADRVEGKPVQRVENKHEGDITLFLSNVEKKAKDVEDPSE